MASSVLIFVLFKQYPIKIVELSRIRTQIAGVDNEQDDHLTTTNLIQWSDNLNQLYV